MLYHLMNSAVMPVPGTYTLQQINQEDFFTAIRTAFQEQKLVSWIGYPQNAQIIKKRTGISIELNRDPLKIQPFDKILIMRLKYRVDGMKKGEEVNEADFDYFNADYTT